jgi:mannose-6-phosphate isomerase-like protein (cupin superfamily)
MPEPEMIPPGGGELVGSSPSRTVAILCDADPLHATWSRFGPGQAGADLHVHRAHTDVFYVLAGELTLRLGPAGDPVAMPAGTLARVPPLVVHGFANAGTQDMQYLNLHAPGRGFAGYLRSLRDGIAGGYDQEDPPSEGGRPAALAQVGGGEVVTDRPGLRVALLADAGEVGVAETWTDGTAPAAPAHVHREHAEALWVLEGELVLVADGRELRAAPGSWIRLPAGVAHAVGSAPGGGPVRFLEVHAPGGGFGAFVRARGAGTDEMEAARKTGFDAHAA